jgi:hypothetical protein
LKIGKLRPAIVLYDEPHPNGDLIGTIQAADAAKRPDLLIIMGTSLKVYGLKRLVKDFAQVVHASTSKNGLGGGKVIYVNLTEPAGSEWGDVIDYHVNGTTDDFAHFVESHWRKIRPSDWEIQTTLTDSPNGLKVVKETVKPAKPGKPNQFRRYLTLTAFQRKRRSRKTKRTIHHPSFKRNPRQKTKKTARLQCRRRLFRYPPQSVARKPPITMYR